MSRDQVDRSALCSVRTSKIGSPDASKTAIRLAMLAQSAGSCADRSGVRNIHRCMSMTRRASPAAGRSLPSLILAEPPRDEPGDRLEASLGVLALCRHGDGRALGGPEGEDAHDRAPADGLAAAGHGDVRGEALDGLHQFRRGAGVQALAVDDRQLAGERAFGNGGRRAILGLGAVDEKGAHFPASTRDATLMYLRPASWAWRTACPKGSSSRTLASLISIGRLMPATTSTEPPFMHDRARFDGVPPNMSVSTTTPSPVLTRFTAATMSLRRDSMSSSGPMVMVSICVCGPTTCSRADLNSVASCPCVTSTIPIMMA